MTDNFFQSAASSKNQFIFKDEKRNVELWLKREDLLHPKVSGNKFRKLKYNLLEAKEKEFDKLLTFGGAFSNHISATAAAGQEFGMKTIGVIRGEELGQDLYATLEGNPTLKFAHSCGMEFHFVSREEYRNKNSEEFIFQLQKNFGNFFLIPEGGTNHLAIKGCEEILKEEDFRFTHICCAVGTGGTISGIINSALPHQQVLGFPALKGDFLNSEIQKFSEKNNWKLVNDYHFGGYAKVNKELILFINRFKTEFKVQLDPVYTGKIIYGLFEMINSGFFPENTCILAIHTGGLQGIFGMNKFLKSKNLPLIEFE